MLENVHHSFTPFANLEVNGLRRIIKSLYCYSTCEEMLSFFVRPSASVVNIFLFIILHIILSLI